MVPLAEEEISAAKAAKASRVRAAGTGGKVTGKRELKGLQSGLDGDFWQFR